MISLPEVALMATVDALVDDLGGWCHLYMTDISITRDTTLADLVELDVPGYSPQPVSGWSPATIIDGIAVSQADPIRFTRTTGSPGRMVYGYYITEGLSGPLLWLERGQRAPYPMQIGGDSVLVIARFGLGPCGVTPRYLLDGAGDLAVTLLPFPLLLDGAGDLNVTASASGELVDLDGAGDLDVTFPAPPVVPTYDLDGAGDLDVTTGPPGELVDLDGAGDLDVTTGPPGELVDLDGAGDLEATT